MVALALVTLYSTQAFESSPAPAPSAGKPAPVTTDSRALAQLVTDNPREQSSDGQQFRWLSRRGLLTLKASAPGRFWVAFRARSLGRPRRLELRSRAGQTLSRVIQPRIAPYIVGPVKLDSRLAFTASALPGPQRASAADPRRLSIALQSVHVTPTRLAAFASVGFYPDEEFGGRVFNWLNQRGQLIVAGPASARRAWIQVALSSIKGTRSVRFTGPGLDTVATAPEQPTLRQVVLGPIALRHGRVSLQVVAQQKPVRLGVDDRLLSIQINDVRVYDRQP